ncbi:MAG TPA: hypothetical protein VMS37_05875 [Verrucomicrobiae bacterium]|nr:hypothetical protein [Verrucomicrobiae bacterium]
MMAVIAAIILFLHRDRLQHALTELSRNFQHSWRGRALGRQDFNGLCILGLLLVILILETGWLAKRF